MTEDETRYRKQKRTEESKARHGRIVQKFVAPVEDRWEHALEVLQPPCVKAGLPSPWMDYDSVPEHREGYETDAPSEDRAKKLCAECPIRDIILGGNGLCSEYAMATGQAHGVWGGRAREDKKWLHGRTAHTAKAT